MKRKKSKERGEGNKEQFIKRKPRPALN